VISDFLQAIDAAWQPPEPAPIVLRLIGSTALMLQTDYVRGTKDSDVLETADVLAETRTRLLDLAGPGTQIHRAHRIYIEFVGHAIPFLSQSPTWKPVSALDSLASFRIVVLDVVDVVVSKLVRFHANDIRDIEAMVERELVHPRSWSIASEQRWTSSSATLARKVQRNAARIDAYGSASRYARTAS